MLNKFMFLLTYGLKKKFKSKAFIITNIVLLVLLVAIANINNIIGFFGGDFTEESNIYVINNSDYEVKDLFVNNFTITNDLLDIEIDQNIEFVDKDYDVMLKDIEDSRNILIVFENHDDNFISAKVVSVGYIDTVLYQVMYQALNTTKYHIALSNSDVDPEELAKVSAPIDAERVLLDEDKKSEEEQMNMIAGVVFPTIILPFYILIIMLVQLIGGEINEEKQTRSMEVIISNVTPKVHFFSKILASNIFIITQTLLIFLYGVLGMKIKDLFGTTGLDLTGGVTSGLSGIVDSIKSTGIMDKLAYIVPLGIILMILSFLAYSLLAGVLASMTVSIEDYQQIQTPIMMICLLGYMLAFMAGSFEGSTFIKVLSYVPFISCLLSPALLMIGQIGIIDIVISIVVILIFNLIFMKYGMRIYKIGILNYSSDKLWRRIFKAVKTN